MTTYKCKTCGNEFSAETVKERCLACTMRMNHGIKAPGTTAPAVQPAPAPAVQPAPPVTIPVPKPAPVQHVHPVGATKKERQRWAYKKYTEKNKNGEYTCPVCKAVSKGFYCSPCRKQRSRDWRAARKAKKA